MKTCETCGTEFAKRSKEAYWQYAERRFCGRRCAALSRPRKPNSEIRYRYRQVGINGKKMLEHRYVMEQHLGRALRSDEHVHHLNHDRLDNRIENLAIVDPVEHARHHSPQIHPLTKDCVICGANFTPHPTKRRRQQTCSPECKGALLSVKGRERWARVNG